MRKIFLFIAILAIAHTSSAQFTTTGTNTTTTNSVGIGTANPTAGKLQVNGSIDLLSLFSDGNVAHLNAYNNSDFRIIQRSNSMMTFWTNTVERMRIDASGKIGIGTINLSEQLTIRDPSVAYDSSSGGSRIRFDSGYGGGGIGFEKETYNSGGLRFYTQWGYGSTLEKMRITANGNVGIGTTNPDQLLSVAGTIHAQAVKVDMLGWPDYVFKPSYELPTLSQLHEYIKNNQHLPEIPSEKEVEKNGVNLGEMNKALLKKVEELTLYLIQNDKKITSQQLENDQQNQRIVALEKALSTLIAK